MDLYGEPVVYVDIETSGGSYDRSKIIEIAAIRVEDGQVVREFKTLLNPGTSIPYWITKLTGIQDNDVVDAPYFEDVAYELNDILDNAIFIAHNVRFDYSFIKRQLEGSGFKYNPKLLCTVRLSRALYPEHRGHSLEKIIARHNLRVAGRHRAYDDAKAIMDFTRLAYKEHGSYNFAVAVAKQLKTRSLPPNLDESYMLDIQNKPGVYVFEDENGSPMYIGKSVNIRNRVLSHFNQDTKVSKEMKISQSTHKVRAIETRNELEALLLESKMVKELMPLHNRQLRRQRQSFVLLKDQDEHGYTTINVEAADLSTFEDISDVYGVYASRSKAKASLENKLRTFDLCPKLLGLEKTSGACFNYQLHKCKGACSGAEPTASYNSRVETALEHSKVENWKYKSPVVISTGDGTNIVVDKWVVLGYIEEVEEAEPVFRSVERRFDIDTYRILRGYIKKHINSLKIIPMPASGMAID
jgi:DNA polymerase-3 subunit epsilon